jgi:FkbM family methyltransferase
MTKFSLVIIGSHNGSGLEKLILNQKNKVLLIEPVHYNFELLKKKFSDNKNIILEKVGISDQKNKSKFYYVKKDSVKKLGKEWASGIGSFKKKHLLDHYRKRFKINENDICEEEVNILTFDDLVKKYSIEEIDFLFIDTEGHDYQIVKSIDFKKIIINQIKFEYKHLDDTFKFDNRLIELKNMFKKINFKEVEIDDENICFQRIA